MGMTKATFSATVKPKTKVNTCIKNLNRCYRVGNLKRLTVLWSTNLRQFAVEWSIGILKRLGQLLGAVREKALIVLESIRDEYPKDLIYSRVTKFLIDQTQNP